MTSLGLLKMIQTRDRILNLLFANEFCRQRSAMGQGDTRPSHRGIAETIFCMHIVLVFHSIFFLSLDCLAIGAF